jgi:lactoylglutathione lyase
LDPSPLIVMPVFLHTRIRVGDLERTIAWYRGLGFECTRRVARSPQGNELAFLQIPGSAHALELCYQAGYKLVVPEDLMHTAVGYPDLVAKCAELEKQGYKIWPEDWRRVMGSGRRMAFVTDPDGYEVELLEEERNSVAGAT